MNRTTVIRAFVTGALMLALSVAAVDAGGCAAQPAPPQPAAPGRSSGGTSGGTTSAPAPGAPQTGTVAKPGVTSLPDGTSSALGTLQFRNLEGGIWVVVDSLPGPDADKAKVLVVIANPELFSLDALKGAYVRANGTIAKGAVTTSMAGPQMIANTLTRATGQP